MTLALGTHVFVYLGQHAHGHAWTARFSTANRKGSGGFSTILYDSTVL